MGRGKKMEGCNIINGQKLGKNALNAAVNSRLHIEHKCKAHTRWDHCDLNQEGTYTLEGEALIRIAPLNI